MATGNYIKEPVIYNILWVEGWPLAALQLIFFAIRSNMICKIITSFFILPYSFEFYHIFSEQESGKSKIVHCIILLQISFVFGLNKQKRKFEVFFLSFFVTHGSLYIFMLQLELISSFSANLLKCFFIHISLMENPSIVRIYHF